MLGLWMWVWLLCLHSISVLAVLRTKGRKYQNGGAYDEKQADEAENENVHQNAEDKGGDTNREDDAITLAGPLLETMQ
jgi:hypothetical protein